MDDYDRRIATVGPTILLSTGRYFDFTNPTPLTLEEVAHALAHICRFTGHSRGFYSVAQHSILVALLLPPALRKWGLFHDAVEAVVGDMAGPLKRLLPEYKVIEDRCERVILAGFGLDADAKPPEIKHADLVALRTEQRDLMHIDGGRWPCLDGIQPSVVKVTCWHPEEARRRFLILARELMGAPCNCFSDGKPITSPSGKRWECPTHGEMRVL
jgi:hypothetical protein